MAQKPVFVNVRISRALKGRLERLKRDSGVTLQAMIQRAILAYLEATK